MGKRFNLVSDSLLETFVHHLIGLQLRLQTGTVPAQMLDIVFTFSKLPLTSRHISGQEQYDKAQYARQGQSSQRHQCYRRTLAQVLVLEHFIVIFSVNVPQP